MQERIDRAEEALLASAMGQSIGLRPVEARKLAEIVLLATDDAHSILVWGPAVEGERTSKGRVIEVPGWVWTCSCGQSGIGYPTEDEAEQWADRHLDT